MSRRRVVGTGQGRLALQATLLVAGSIALLAAATLLLDRRGVSADFFPYRPDAEGEPLFSVVQERPRLDSARAGELLHDPSAFAVRWRGWLAVPEEGEHRFLVSSSGSAFLVVDGTRSPGGESLSLDLEPGLHPLEIGYRSEGGRVELEVLWQPPGAEVRTLEPGALFPDRPGLLRRSARRLFADSSPTEQRLAGWGLLALATLLAWAVGVVGRRTPGSRPSLWRRAHERMADRSWPRPAFFAALLVLASIVILPFTGSPLGPEDVRSLEAAVLLGGGSGSAPGHAHLYLLRLFIGLAAGDPFVGARLLWSVLFGVTVSALAVGAASLGARLQLGSFALSLLLLLCQPLYFSRAGAAMPEATAGALAAAAVALFLHRLWKARQPSIEWQVLAIGGLTVWAVASRELSFALLFLPLLFLLDRRRVSLRAFGSKLLAWATGAACGLALLMVLDFLWIGDFWLSLRPSSFQASLAVAETEPTFAPGLLYLGLLVLVAAALATGLGKRLEVRLVHLLPLLYLALVALIRMPGGETLRARDLLPILPAACLLAAAGFSYLGLDDLRWLDLSSPRFFLPALGLLALVATVALPYREGRVTADDLPLAGLQRALGWSSPEALLEKFLAPLVVIALAGLLVFAHRHLTARVMLLTALLIFLLGPSFRETLRGFAIRDTAQRSEARLYPLRTLAGELRGASPAVVMISPALMMESRPFGDAAQAESLLRIWSRGEVELRTSSRINGEVDFAFGTSEDLRRWIDFNPGLGPNAIELPWLGAGVVRPARTMTSADGGGGRR